MTSKALENIFLAGLAVWLAGCQSNPGSADVERLREENRRLRERVERLEEENRQLRGQPLAPDKVYAHFASDPAEGSLAGLKLGYTLTSARHRYGQENRARSWTTDRGVVFQYEWDLVGGLVLRVDTDAEQEITRVAVVLDESQEVNLPTLLGLRIGQETYATLQQRFSGSLHTGLELWGAQGYYTVSQWLPLSDTRQLRFVYQMPAGLGEGELERIKRAVQVEENTAVLAPHLEETVPYLVALERPR